jgi:hypothetical protein
VNVHRDVADTVDSILRGYRLPAEVRHLTGEGEVEITEEEPEPTSLMNARGSRRRSTQEPTPLARGAAASTPSPTPFAAPEANRGKRIYPFGVSRTRLQQAMRDVGAGSTISERLDEADIVLTDRSYYRRKPAALKDAESRGVPIFVLKSNTLVQMQQALLSMESGSRVDPVLDAMTEAEEAIHSVIQSDRAVDLAPQGAYIRRLQHELAQRFNLSSQSRGREPQRRVRIAPGSSRAYFSED